MPAIDFLVAAAPAAIEEDHPLAKKLSKFDDIVGRALRRAIRAGTSSLGDVLVSAAQPQAPAEPNVSLDDLTAIETSWRDSMTAELLPYLGSVYVDGAASTFDEVLTHLAEAAAAAGPTVDLSSPAAAVHLAEASNRLRGVGTDVWRSVRAELVDGFQQGEDIDQLKRRVREEMASSTIRAQTIARTEVISASNAGGHAQIMALDPAVQPTTKTWLATGDRRTRLAHRAADGQTVAVDGRFEVGGDSLLFPGDPNGSADNIINCRCTTTWGWDDSAIGRPVLEPATSGLFGPLVDPADVMNRADLEEVSRALELPPDDATWEYFYHSTRSSAQLEAIAKEGIKGGGGNASTKVFLSKDEVRDLHGGVLVVRVPAGQAKEGRDFVERGLEYREWTVDEVPQENLVRAVRSIKIASGEGFTINEDELARFALKEPDSSEAADLPKKYQRWFKVAGRGR